MTEETRERTPDTRSKRGSQISEPDVEVLLAEVVRRRRCGCSSTTPTASRSRCASASRTAQRLPRPLLARGVLARPGPAAHQAPALQPLPRPPRARCACASADATATRSLTGELVGASEQEVTIAADDGVVTIPYDADRPLEPRPRRLKPMSREIVEAVRGLAAEKNISSEKLMEALEDALLSAYKKTPGAARYAKVEMDRDSGDFKVWELKIPPELEEQLLVEATDRAAADGRPRDRRDARAARARDRPREAQASTRTRSRPRTSPPTTSAGSPRRPPSR